jgi:glycosyltransferase involved in cell wall biosynthesis
MRILVQGIGCTETGARIVLRELLAAAPAGNRYWVIATDETAQEFVGKSSGWLTPDIYVFGLSHRVFGRWLRIPLEFGVALLSAVRVVDRVVNLSHYGLCLTPRFGLYVHSPLLMDFSNGIGWQEGRPNPLKRWLLHTCIRRAQPFILQTQGMQAQLIKYCGVAGLPVPKNRIMRPKVEITAPATTRRSFAFQLFYPTSRFVHKRAELAVAAGKLAHDRHSETGLVITVPVESVDGGALTGVKALGRISREQVYEWFAGSDALLFTSERETLGLPLLEALEFGLPVIAPRLAYAVEILGDAGCYFDGDTPESVLAAIEDCRSNLASWREKIKARAAVVRQDAATWSEHWQAFLNNS